MSPGKPDRIFLASTVLLLVAGLLVLASASSVISNDRFGHPYGYVARQALLGFLGGAAGFLIAYRIPYQRWRTSAPVLLFIALILLGLVFVPGLGVSLGGARRWLHIGSFSVQPAEFLKLALIFYLAAWFSKRPVATRSLGEGPFPFIIVLGVVGALLALQPDVGTFGVILATSITMYFVSGGKVRHLLLTGGVVLAALALLIPLAPYRLGRITTFLNPQFDPQGIGYQLRQSLIAIGSGGTTGLGLGYSLQKHYYVPETFGDAIFAILAEEVGLIGVLSFLVLLGIFLFRTLRIARRAPDEFGQLVAAGVAAWIGFQSFINIGATTGIVPFTGIPLPFVSYGGTALMFVLVAAGVVANISRQGRQ
ncbi:MAG: putative lipid II flippase FtsW [bacterium]|nr:putative lipid II flippase FtsW [bacterium]MDZ4296219.1 putative lipid II flippase FtsW [Patescibacteria group bacterium]